MNFLSHYYFERHSHDPELVMGSVLPDLLKMAAKANLIHPMKHADELTIHPKVKSLYNGWERHIVTDKLFHNSAFFYDKTHELKLLLTPVITDTPIRPSFLSHIALELLMDHLLLLQNFVHEQDFYEYLAAADREAIARFLSICGVEDSGFFFRFFNSFMRSQYIGSYRQLDQVTYALINICSLLWDLDIADSQRKEITSALRSYVPILAKDYKSIFDVIRPKLS